MPHELLVERDGKFPQMHDYARLLVAHPEDSINPDTFTEEDIRKPSEFLGVKFADSAVIENQSIALGQAVFLYWVARLREAGVPFERMVREPLGGETLANLSKNTGTLHDYFGVPGPSENIIAGILPGVNHATQAVGTHLALNMGPDGTVLEEVPNMPGFVSAKKRLISSTELAGEMDDLLRGDRLASAVTLFTAVVNTLSSAPVTEYRADFRNRLAPRFQGEGQPLRDRPAHNIKRPDAQSWYASRIRVPLERTVQGILGPGHKHVAQHASEVFVARA